MRLRNPRDLGKPELMIIPMIDIMFFLLVFFMLSTMYMVDLKTIPVRLPKAESSTVDTASTFAVTLKEDGSLYLGDAATDKESLLLAAAMEKKNNANTAVIIRADENVDYGRVIELVDSLKGAGITRFGLAAGGNGQ
ncbi:MAG: biopolymer transporter ExbD [Phascolarctobacterium sp.]|nr:MAG: biopolymer transporter ExbD [Phascolarctobacterium sp.]